MADPEHPSDPDQGHVEEQLDEALEESFPASDPLPPDIGRPDKGPPQ